jgi:hypothetical protein
VGASQVDQHLGTERERVRLLELARGVAPVLGRKVRLAGQVVRMRALVIEHLLRAGRRAQSGERRDHDHPHRILYSNGTAPVSKACTLPGQQASASRKYHPGNDVAVRQVATRSRNRLDARLPHRRDARGERHEKSNGCGG